MSSIGPGDLSNQQITPSSSTTDADSMAKILGPAEGFSYTGPMKTLDGMRKWLHAKAEYLAKDNPAQADSLKQAADDAYGNYVKSIITFCFNQFKQAMAHQQEQAKERKQLYG